MSQLQNPQQMGLKADKNAQNDSQNLKNNLDFEQGLGFFGRLFLINVMKVAIKIKRVLKKGHNLSHEHIPQLKDDQLPEKNSQKFIQNLTKIMQKGPLQPMKVWIALLSVFAKKIQVIFLYLFTETSLKLFNSVALNFCIEAITNEETSTAYIWGAVMICSNLFSSLFVQNGWELGINLNAEIRSVMINTTYKKINQLSAYSIKSANLGKVVNLISGDLNTTEAKFFYLFSMVVAPFTLTGACIILVFRLGYFGLLAIVFLLSIFPAQKFFGKVASKYTSKRIQRSDERVKLTKEIIDGIQIIKMYGWEKAIQNIIERIRSEEIGYYIKVQILQYIEKAISTSSVFLSAALTFIIIYYKGSTELDSAKIFSTIEMLQYVKTSVFLFSGLGFGYIFELQIFLKRFIDIYSIKNIEPQIDNKNNFIYLKEDEMASFNNLSAFYKQPQPIQENAQTTSPGNIATVEQVQTEIEIAQLQEKREKVLPILKDLTFSIKRGELLGVVGKTGCGKSTLLNCFLKEIPYFQGNFEFREVDNDGKQIKLAYVEQEPYVFSSTIRDNILFGKPYNEEWYNKVIQASCLNHDFENIDKGDQTMVGERGANLSGGQKSRVSLARAMYSDADVYLLDDPLSAVDSKVAKNIISNAICGLLKNKTIILVTHQIHFTKNCDRILILEDNGSLKTIGGFDDVFESLKSLAAKQIKFEKEETKSAQATHNEESQKEEIRTSLKELNQEENSSEENSAEVFQKIQQEKYLIKQDEVVNVSFNTYLRFIKVMHQQIFGLPLIIFLVFIVAEGFYAAFQRGLSYYDSTSDEKISTLFGLLIVFSCSYLITNAIKQILFSYGILKESKFLHDSMLHSLLRAPLVFFDKISSGNLMNKFSNDISLIDSFLHFTSNDSLDIVCNFFNLLITCCVYNPYIVIPSIFEILVLYWFFHYTKDIVIKSKQMDLANKSPVFAYFSSTLQGITPIKVYGQNQHFQNQMTDFCNKNLQANMTFWLCSRFFGGYIQIISIFFSAVGVFIIISLPSSNPALSAQSLTYFMMMVDSIQWCLRQILNTNSAMSSCERIQNLIEQPSEASLLTDHLEKMESKQEIQWPNSGQVQFNNVVMRYRKELNPVLKGINFSIKAGEKVGCVGRTGAGKSSIIQTLFRLTEAESGSQMLIDGVDIQKLGLHTLRQNISIIPQVPFVFAGTIRRNLDPFNLYTDEKLWEVLRMVELENFTKMNSQNGLDTDMGASSCSFSVGQKQLICLARALLKKNKLLVLDEATSNVDMETDQFIQNTLRTKFSEYTIITIAHRLNSIADYDKVIVMDDGVVVEFDTPFKLLANNSEDISITKNSIFAQMVKNTGDKNSSNIFQTAKNKYINDEQKKINI